MEFGGTSGNVFLQSICTSQLSVYMSASLANWLIIEVNDTEVPPILFHRPSMTSTFDTSPLEADLDDEQIKAMLASPLYQQEREKQVQTNH